jgi:hypothetical protein
MPLRMLLSIVGWWARQWQQWQQSEPPRGSLRLSPVIPLVLYTATRPWGSNQSLADLIDCPEELRRFLPDWQPEFWNLGQRSAEELLAGGPWMQFLAVMRTGEQSPELFRSTLQAAGQNLTGLEATDPVRWGHLLRLVMEFSVWRRPRQERDDIIQTLRQTNPTRQAEVQAMSQTIAGQWLEEGEQRGELREARRALRAVAGAKFDPLPASLLQQWEACTDLDWLRSTLLRVGTAKQPEELAPPQAGA